jgi:hypothetical protein
MPHVPAFYSTDARLSAVGSMSVQASKFVAGAVLGMQQQHPRWQVETRLQSPAAVI